MTISWTQVSTELTEEQVGSTYEPVGRFILVQTQFDLAVGRLILAFSGLSRHNSADYLLQTIDAVNKKRILESFSSIYASDPNGLVPDYKPQPQLRKRIKTVASAFEKSCKIRNTLAHGTIGRVGERVFVGSVAATAMFKNTGGAESWVYVDQIDYKIEEMFTGMSEATRLRQQFILAHETVADANN